MLSFTIDISPETLSLAKNNIVLALYGQRVSDSVWVYFDGKDYLPTINNGSVSGFQTCTSPRTYPILLPDDDIVSCRIIIGLSELPTIATDASGAPQAPSIDTQSIYDFVEFSYTSQINQQSATIEKVLYINTSMVDQFGFSIRLQIQPAESTAPNGVGVIISRDDVFQQYPKFVQAGQSKNSGAYLQCVQDPSGKMRPYRIVAPKAALLSASISGLVVKPNQPHGNLSGGNYYYAISPVYKDSNGSEVEGYTQSTINQTSTADGTGIRLEWAPTTGELAQVDHFNIYRGTYTAQQVTWVLAGTVANNGAIGGAFDDSGAILTANDTKAPYLNPLTTSFDVDIQTFFKNYQNPNQILALSATDGSENGYSYTFDGITIPNDPSVTPLYLQLTLKQVIATTTNNSVANPPIPVGTPFIIYYPYWNSNTFDPNNSAPPQWMQDCCIANTIITASEMVLAAEGVFADNEAQKAHNLPQELQTATDDEKKKFSVLLGSLENQIVAAITRGIANTTSPSNWVDSSEFFPANTAWSVYDAFFHKKTVSQDGFAYASPYDDQGGQSSTLSTVNPTSVKICI